MKRDARKGPADSTDTVDAILRGRVKVIQPREGARFTTDPILLADFVVRTMRARAHRACDLGAGTGVLSFVLAALDPRVSIEAIELQEELALRAERGARLNGLADRVRVRAADLRKLARPQRPFDLVVSNPPYHREAAGPAAPARARALARHELTCTLPDLVSAARRLLSPRGHLALVHPAERLPDLVRALDAERFRLTALRFIHPRADRPAQRLLALARIDSRASLMLLPPLVLHVGKGWSEEVMRVLDGLSSYRQEQLE